MSENILSEFTEAEEGPLVDLSELTTEPLEAAAETLEERGGALGLRGDD